MQICPAYQLSGLSVLICIKLIKLYKNEIIQKIRAKRESGLTAVRLKRDPPVFKHFIFFSLYGLMLAIFQICQLRAGDKLLDDLDVKNSVITISHHLKPKNTVLTRELVRKLKNSS